MEKSITNAAELKACLNKAIAGDKGVLFSIGKYIAYNYYMCFHIKEGSDDDLENEKNYSEFKNNHPDLYAQVEGWVTFNHRKFQPGYVEPDIF